MRLGPDSSPDASAYCTPDPEADLSSNPLRPSYSTSDSPRDSCAGETPAGTGTYPAANGHLMWTFLRASLDRSLYLSGPYSPWPFYGARIAASIASESTTSEPNGTRRPPDGKPDRKSVV